MGDVRGCEMTSKWVEIGEGVRKEGDVESIQECNMEIRNAPPLGLGEMVVKPLIDEVKGASRATVRPLTNVVG